VPLSLRGVWLNVVGSNGALNSLTSQDAIKVTPSLGNIDINGDGTYIVTSGDVATSTLAIQVGNGIAKIYETDNGTATPASGSLRFIGAQGVTTLGAGDIVTIAGITAKTSSSSAISNVGTASFDSESFTVDGNGFIRLKGQGIASDSFQVDAISGTGTNPIEPDATGLIILTGGQVAAATTSNAVQIASTAVNRCDVRIQKTSSSAVTNANINGIAHFDSSSFNVDANGYVKLIGPKDGIDYIGVESAIAPGVTPVEPDGTGKITITGAQVAAGTIGATALKTVSTAANAFQIQAQRADSVAATDITKNGICHFNSAHFNVDSNSYVSLKGPSQAIGGILTDTFVPPGAGTTIATIGGVIGIFAEQVAPGSVGVKAIRTNAYAANQFSVQIQRAANSTVSDLSKNGICHFDSSKFTVDSQGYVTTISESLVLQHVRSKRGDVVTINGTVKFDDTIPQDSEGTVIFTSSITPKSATSVLHLKFSYVLQLGDQETMSALFASIAGTDAIAAKRNTFAPTQDCTEGYLDAYIVTGTTNPIIFKAVIAVRDKSPLPSGTVYLNADSLNHRIFGGTSSTTFIITEYES